MPRPPQRAVRQEHTHKTDPAEVLLSTWQRLDEEAFTVTAHWARDHPFYTDGTRYDPMLFAESVRQSIPLISHVGYAVPLGHHLIWRYFTFEVVPEAMRSAAQDTTVEMRIHCRNVVRRAGSLSALTLHVTAVREGRLLGTATARFSSHSPAVYRRLRGGTPDAHDTLSMVDTPPAGLPAARIGRNCAADAVLADADTTWLLRCDSSHPIYFDHAVDHAPGMLLLEAARQAALASSPSPANYPFRFESAFLRYVELTQECEVTAVPPEAGAAGHFHVTATQNGHTAFSSTVTTL
ncbi:ScbA/BarX family gamma-butyrolactone biosynthesis protein [Streptomyces sp. WAC 04229]|uniref:ScbA/BarX family gamma-butyrolactone biosynthesis protein n=1 Tax=Streptomyces sp. WAC 04229 TaxID=2203206 RepID=UPI003D7599CF